MSKITLLAGGDVCPTKESWETFFAGRAGALLQGGLEPVWREADFRVFNLETPLSDKETPIEKCGPALRAPIPCVKGLASLSPDGVGLSNNHILDQGAQGLDSTIRALEQAGIPHFGAGPSLQQADRPLMLEKDGVRICLYAVCEREFSWADAHGPGANPFDALEIGERIRRLKKECRHLVVLYHGGREYYPYPSPGLQKRCRKLADWGADAVLCQHSHCVGSYERYGGGVLVYGQGNFLFDMEDEPCFDTGLLVRLTFEAGGVRESFIPIRRQAHGAALAAGEDGEAILRGFFQRSEEILEPGFLGDRYHAYAMEQRERMLKVFLSGNLFLRGLNLLYGRRPSRVYSRAAQLAIKNSLQCEALNELLREGL